MTYFVNETQRDPDSAGDSLIARLICTLRSEGYPVKSTQIFIECHMRFFLGYTANVLYVVFTDVRL